MNYSSCFLSQLAHKYSMHMLCVNVPNLTLRMRVDNYWSLDDIGKCEYVKLWSAYNIVLSCLP